MAGGSAHYGDSKVKLFDKKGTLFAKGRMVWRVYLLDAQANIPQAERANVAHTKPQLSWDQWHQCF